MREATVQRWMTVLLQRAERVGEAGEVPVAAVVLDAEGRCIGHGRKLYVFVASYLSTLY